MTAITGGVRFRTPARAQAQLAHLKARTSPATLERIEQQLQNAADPDATLVALARLTAESEATAARLLASPAGLKAAATVFAHSRFLTEQVLRRPELIEELVESGDLLAHFRRERFLQRVRKAANGVAFDALAQTLARLRRSEYLRIVLRDVYGLATLAETTADLSHLADAILQVVYERVRTQLATQHGDATGDFSVVALGKLGGEELNYSSDIDLMFIYATGAGETLGPHPISEREFFEKLAGQMTAMLSGYTVEGVCYRVDLRLRPEGRLGELSLSTGAACQYYQQRARDWELQMLIKARVAAGEREPGQQVLRVAEPLIYASTLDFRALEAVVESRLRNHERAAAKRRGGRGGGAIVDVKLARGGIRDVEFLVQCLQRLHGSREPWVRHGGTLLALTRLRDRDLLSQYEHASLAAAYDFLRNIEHRLQVVDDQQTHTLPTDPHEIELLARRMPEDEVGGEVSAARLQARLTFHLERVNAIYERVIHAQRGPSATLARPEDAATSVQPEADAVEPATFSAALARSLDVAAPVVASLIAQGRLKRNPRGMEHFLERLPADQLRWLNDSPHLANNIIDIFEHASWLADGINRNIDSIEALRTLGVERPRDLVRAAAGDTHRLRREFERELILIEAASLCLQRPVFETLKQTSRLACEAIECAYRIAVDHVTAAHPPRNPAYRPLNQMMVIALGRLGTEEFDVASDADLLFVLPDSSEPEFMFWTRVAGRMIDILTAYTGAGTLFAVDTRLRPGGRDGELVQLERAFAEYFERRAEAWEGIAYMKARGVAGDVEGATAFLTRLQQIDWRRYGQSGRSRAELRQMRMRLEKEQGSSNPLKAGRGGYYDIDFALLYLRLKGAGMFFRSLNTPARIDVVEQMGHLERADARLLSDAAILYRAVDHGIRLQTGHSGGNLPASAARLDQLMGMVSRWTPPHLQDQPLEAELAQIQDKVRDYFDRLFHV